MRHVGHALRRVVDVALEVDQRGFLLEHTVFMPLLDRFDHFVHIGVALADVHVVADADGVRHEADHVGGLADGFAVRDLALALVEILHFKTQQVAGGRKREARARAVVPKQRDAESGIENLGRNVAFAQISQRVGDGEHRVLIRRAIFPR